MRTMIFIAATSVVRNPPSGEAAAGSRSRRARATSMTDSSSPRAACSRRPTRLEHTPPGRSWWHLRLGVVADRADFEEKAKPIGDRPDGGHLLGRLIDGEDVDAGHR